VTKHLRSPACLPDVCLHVSPAHSADGLKRQAAALQAMVTTATAMRCQPAGRGAALPRGGGALIGRGSCNQGCLRARVPGWAPWPSPRSQ